jgi:hypothetical protein
MQITGSRTVANRVLNASIVSFESYIVRAKHFIIGTKYRNPMMNPVL